MAQRWTLTLILLLGVTAPAHADLYDCKDRDGRSWIRNYKVPGEKCKLVMKTGSKKKAPKVFNPPTAIHRVKELEPTQKPRKRKSPKATTSASATGSLAERMELYAPYIAEASEKYQIPASFIRAVIRVESSFQYKAESGAGAQGLMQLMPKTARAMGVNDSFDPRQNIMGGTRFLRRLANKYDGDMVKVLSAYNAGPGAVAKKGGGIPYVGTEGYVRAVLDHYYRFKALAD